MSSEHKYIFEPLGSEIKLIEIKPNYNMIFHRDGKQIGVLDFNGPEMVFSGDMDESAKVFFDYVATSFKARLDKERADEREAIIDLVAMYGGTVDLEAAIRARSNT